MPALQAGHFFIYHFMCKPYVNFEGFFNGDFDYFHHDFGRQAAML